MPVVNLSKTVNGYDDFNILASQWIITYNTNSD